MTTYRWLALLIILAFGQTLLFPFIALDDAKHIWQNPYVMGGGWGAIKTFWSQAYYGLYIPIIYTSWIFLAQLSQVFNWLDEVTVIKAWPFHFFNVVIHFTNTVLVFRLFEDLFKSEVKRKIELTEVGRYAALAVTIIFALHPLVAEPVAWVSGLKDVMSFGFSLAALHLLRRQRLALASIAYFAAILAKPSAIALPFIAMTIYLWLPRIGWRPPWRTLILWLIATMPVMWLTKSYQPDARLEFTLSLYERFLLPVASLGFYVIKFILPYPLSPDYGFSPPVFLRNPLFAIWLGSGILWVVAAIIALYRKTSPWSVYFAWPILALGPVLGIIPFEYQNMSTVADRYAYGWPILGFSAIMVLACQKYFSPSTVRRGAILIAIVLIVTCAWQTRLWQSNESLFSWSLQHNSQSYLSLSNLGLQKMRKGELQEAEEFFQKAIIVKPDYLAAIANLGVIYFKQGTFQRVVDYYVEVLKKLPDAGPGSPAVYGDMHFNLGASYVNLGQLQSGILHLQKAVLINPDHSLAHFNLGRVFAATGQREAAIKSFAQVLRLKPNDPQTVQELAKIAK